MFSRILITNTSLVLLFVWNPSAQALPPQPQKLAHNHKTSTKSNPIGRLLSAGDRNKQKGSLIFSGDRIDPTGDKVEVLCYLNRKVLNLGEGLVDDAPNKCVDTSSTKIGKCTPPSRSYCPKPKTPRANSETPIVTVPYSNVILNPRPSMSWHQIPGADSYTVTLSGEGSNWSQQTKTNTLTYPNQSALQSGNVYKLNVIASQEGTPISTSSTVLILLPKSESQQIEANIKQVQDLSLPPDQQARDLDTIFRSKDLLTQSIQVLKKRTDAGTNNPTLHRLLGDRYLEAGFPQKAKSSYKKAKALAKKVNNDKEQKLAEAGCRNVISFLNNITE